MPKFRKKPVVIEAWIVRDLIMAAANYQLPESIFSAVENDGWVFANDVIHIPTLEGIMTAGLNDYVIRGVAGEFYPCKPEIFAATYESAE